MGEDTSIIHRGPCPCEKGRAVAYHSTPDHGWPSGGWTTYGLECDECSQIYAVHGSTILLKTECKALGVAEKSHYDASARLHELINPLVDDYFAVFASRPMTRQLDEMKRLSIFVMNITEYRRERNRGKSFSALCRPMKNPDWVHTLVSKAALDEKYRPLENEYLQTAEAERKLKNEMSRTAIPELRFR